MFAKPALACLLLLAIPVFAQNPTAPATRTSAPTPTQAKPTNASANAPAKPAMATWTEFQESTFGISKDQFSLMGLSKLTATEYLTLLGWAAERERKAEEDAKATAISQTLTYSCGRTVTKPEEYDKVNIYLDIQDRTPSEIASRIRQNFRAINDVQVVFSRNEADLTLTILGFEIPNTISNQPLGYTVSTIVTEDCVSKLRTIETPFERYITSYLNTGPRDSAGMVESITRSIDATEIELQRKVNAFQKQQMLNK